MNKKLLLCVIVFVFFSSCVMNKYTKPTMNKNTINMYDYSYSDSINSAIIDGFGYKKGMYLLNSY